jgi:hypothetical protein
MWGIFEINELARTMVISINFLLGCFYHDSPKLKPISTSSNKVNVVEMLMLVDSKVTSTYDAHPVGSSFARDYGRNIFGVKRGNTDLCDEFRIPLISFNINTDKDHRSLLLKSS